MSEDLSAVWQRIAETLAQRRKGRMRPDVRGLASLADATGVCKTTLQELINDRKLQAGERPPTFFWGGKHCGYNDLLFLWAEHWRPKRTKRGKKAA